MSPSVFCQVVATHEAAVANGTGKLFLPRVSASVARQLVRAGESPLAAFPLALEGLLTCMRPHVGLEVRALEIGFVAVVAGTNMAA